MIATLGASRRSGLRYQLQLPRARNGGGGDHDATLSRVSRRKPPRARFISAPLKGGSVNPRCVHARLGRDRVSDSVSTVAAKRKFSASEDKTHPKKVGENFIERRLETE